MVPIATHRGTVTRPSGALVDADEAVTSVTTIATGVPCALTSPVGADQVANGRQEIVDAVLTFPPAPTLSHLDFWTDDATGERYRVAWVRARRGFGLDHQAAGLVAVKGGAGG